MKTNAAEEIVEIFRILNQECTGVSPQSNWALNRLGILASDAERRLRDREEANRRIMQENLGK